MPIPPPTIPAPPPNQLPSANDTCLQCSYPLRNLKSWRCPECGSPNSKEQRAAAVTYCKNANKFAFRCSFYPLAIIIGIETLIIGITQYISHPNSAPLFALGTLIGILYLPLQFATLIFAAARLTQVRLMRRQTPSAFSVNPIRALTLFLSNFIWRVLVIGLTICLIVGWLATLR